jgi:hypothetical protein
MILIYTTIALIIILLICLLAGIIAKNKILQYIGIGIFILVIVFWIGFFIWAMIEIDQEYERQFGDGTSNAENEDELAEDITTKFLDNKVYYKVGKIEKIRDNKIYFSDNDKNKYILENSEQINYINGRTAEKYTFDNLKEGYYINLSNNKNCYVFRNITGDELKKELLISLSLPDTVDMLRTSVDDVKSVKQLGNNEALVTFEISDIIRNEDFSDYDNGEINVTLKVDNNTKYNTNFNGNTTYDANTIEDSKSLMLYIRLDSSTLKDEYPCVSMFDSYSN